MAKFNEKKMAKQPTETNFMGEDAYKMEDKEELVSTVMTTFLHDSYYEKEKDKVVRIQSLLSKVDPLFAAKLAICARNDGKLRSVTHLIAADIAKYISGAAWGKRFYNKIVNRIDDMSEIVSAYAAINGMKPNCISKIPNSIKRGFKEALERMDAYQLDKYKMKRRTVSLVDLIRLFHPKGTDKNKEAFSRLINSKPLDDLYSSKILEKEMTKAGKNTIGLSDEEKLDEKRKAISDVINNIGGMPIMNLIRNLCNIIKYAPNEVDKVCEQLRNKDKILNSKLLPFRFASAYKMVKEMTINGNSEEDTIKFETDEDSEKFEECKKKILDAIEDALSYSVNNIPQLDGNTAVLIDHSASVRGSHLNNSGVSAFSRVKTAMIGNLFGTMMAYSQKNVYIGLFGDKLINVPINRDMKMLEFNDYSYDIGSECGGCTETGIYEFMRECIKDNKKVDNVVVFSDCQIGDGRKGFTAWFGHSALDRGDSFQKLFKKFKKINPKCNWIVVNIAQSGGTCVFDKSMGIMNIAGWSEKIFDVILSQARGWDAMIKEIESITI